MSSLLMHLNWSREMSDQVCSGYSEHVIYHMQRYSAVVIGLTYYL